MLEWKGRGVGKIKREGTTQFGSVAGETTISNVVNTHNINIVNRHDDYHHTTWTLRRSNNCVSLQLSDIKVWLFVLIHEINSRLPLRKRHNMLGYRLNYVQDWSVGSVRV